MLGWFGTSQREKQIEAFESGFPAAACKQTDKSLFDVPFVAAGHSFTLRVFLPPKFPEVPPVLQLLRPLRHPWVNQYNQVTGHAYLAHWSDQFELVTLVKEVLLELSKPPNETAGAAAGGGATPAPSPATLPASTTQQPIGAHGAMTAASIPDPVNATPPPSYTDAARGMGGHTQHQQYSPTVESSAQQYHQQPSPRHDFKDEPEPEPAFRTSLPGIPPSFPELEALSLEQLQRLLRDDVAFQTHMGNMDTVKTMRDLREQIIEENANIAQGNLTRREEYEALRAETLALQLQLQEMKDSFQQRVQKQLDADESRLSDAAILDQIRAAASDAENRSDDISADFSSGTLPVKEFLAAYMPVRKTYHRRNSFLEMSHKWLTR